MRNCPECQTPVGCRITQTCKQGEAQMEEFKKEPVNAPAQEERKPEQLANPVPQGTAAQAAPVDSQVQQAAAAAMAQSRLCRGCKHALKPLTAPGWNWANCTHAALPVNLVTGQKVFPCVIARGYEELCGWIGRLWEHK